MEEPENDVGKGCAVIMIVIFIIIAVFCWFGGIMWLSSYMGGGIG